MKKHFPPALLLIASMGFSVLVAHAADTASAADQAFIAKVSQGGMFEVAAGQLAADQADKQDIKDQGATEAHDHKLVGDKLKSIASNAGVTFSDSLNPAFQKELDDLKALSGNAFDKAYLQDMEAIHAKDGAAFAKEATSGSDPKLKTFATETHRIVVRHVGELKALGAS
jgi:putative membrane protein